MKNPSFWLFTLLIAALVALQSLFPAAALAASYDPGNPQILRDAFLEAESAILIEQETGAVLYDMNADERMHPASTTKIMTLLLALENGDLADTVTVGGEIRRIPSDSSKVPLIRGERLTLEELLYGMMLKSGNDAAMTVAVHIAGSVDAFVEMMNQRAELLGCTGTHFANPHGYEDEEHYTTARDLAVISSACMKNEMFRKIVDTERFTIAANNRRAKKLVLKTNNQFVGDDESMEHRYAYGTGMKTGYFSKAKHTFAASATKGDVNLIAVVLRTSREGKWIDAARLMEYGFATYEPAP